MVNVPIPIMTFTVTVTFYVIVTLIYVLLRRIVKTIIKYRQTHISTKKRLDILENSVRDLYSRLIGKKDRGNK